MSKIIIVEDELIAAEYLKDILILNGFEVLKIIDNGEEAMREIPKYYPDIVLMDIMLKDNISGSEVAIDLKRTSPNSAIIFLTAYADNEMVEYAIESNSYGYLMKPYNDKEIINTLKVISKRIEMPCKTEIKLPTVIEINHQLHFDLERKRLMKNQKEVALGYKALLLIESLCKQINCSVSQEQIYQEVWGEAQNSVTLRTMIHRIKSKTGHDFIYNVNGLGYMIKSLPKQ